MALTWTSILRDEAPDARLTVTLEGQFYPAGTSRRQVAQLIVDTGTNTAHVETMAGEQLASTPLEHLVVMESPGGAASRVELPDSGLFETQQSAALARLQAQLQPAPHWRRARTWESRWPYWIGALLLCVGLGALTVFWALPRAADAVAMRLPAQARMALGRGVLAELDRSALTASRLPEAQRRRLSQSFAALVPAADDMDYRLHFRAGNKLGANALALPDGSVVITDELVALASNESQVLGVLAHEVGHVYERHGLKSALYGSGLYVVVSAIVGDVDGAVQWLAAAPAVLLHTANTRGFERAADAYATASLHDLGLPPTALADMLAAMAAAEERDSNTGIGRFLSTHPATDERIKAIRAQQSD